MSTIDLGAWGRDGSVRRIGDRSRVKIRAVALGVILVAGPSFLGVAAAPRSSRDRVAATEATAQPVDPRPDAAVDRVLPGLFSVHAVGVVTEPIRRAADRFLATFPADQIIQAPFPGDEGAWFDRMNVGESPAGPQFATLSPAQREAGFDLVRASVGASGVSSDEGMIKLGGVLDALGSAARIDRITVLGQPSADQPWGWQLEGPSLVVNYFIIGDQVTMTPSFLGSTPVGGRLATVRSATRP